jgi:hypothetical protein
MPWIALAYALLKIFSRENVKTYGIREASGVRPFSVLHFLRSREKMNSIRFTGLIWIILPILCACSFPVREGQPATGSPPAATPSLQTEAVGMETGEGRSLVEVTVYFTDSNRYAIGTPPFEAGVTRQVDSGVDLPRAVLVEFFRGPTEAERTQGLDLITSGFTGFSQLVIEDGIARVYLSGPCRSNGATYTIAQPLIANLSQFETIQAIKIYDAEGTTGDPDGPGNSIPFCLEP